MTSVAIDDRITAAFLEGAKSEEVAPLIAEVEAAALRAGEKADCARDKALDPALSEKDLTTARRQMEDAAFRRDRMQQAAIKLGVRVVELREQEEDRRRWTAYEKARTERDKLANELREIYPQVALLLADLAARIDENDREIKRINTRARPNGVLDLAGAEAVARQLRNFTDGTASIPRITTRLRLPAFEYERHTPYSWPRY